jgi:hypothetical protein
MKWNGTGLGRRRPKLKKGRVSNTQISLHPEAFEAKGPKSQKYFELRSSENPPDGSHTKKILNHFTLRK